MLGWCGSVGYGRVGKVFYVRIARFRDVSVGMIGLGNKQIADMLTVILCYHFNQSQPSEILTAQIIG